MTWKFLVCAHVDSRIAMVLGCFAVICLVTEKPMLPRLLGIVTRPLRDQSISRHNGAFVYILCTVQRDLSSTS